MAKIFKKPRTSTFVFYGLLIVAIAAFFLFMSNLMDKLDAHLAKFQASHINTKYQQEFDRLFADPDWAQLYEEAGIEDTQYEGKQAFADYMQAKVGDQELTCFLASNGITGKKCHVYLGNEEIGTFYMESDPIPEPEEEPWYSDIPFAKSLVAKLSLQSWHYDHLTLNMPQRNHSVTIATADDRIVYVNGVALTDAHRISTTFTLAESYMPEGIEGLRRQVFTESGFLMPPQVTVTDLVGNPIEIVKDDSGNYAEVYAQQAQEPELEEFIINAAKTYCRYMILDTGSYLLSQYYDTSSKTYKDIVNTDRWAIKKPKSYRFGEAVVSGFYRYNDELVTARVTMILYAMREDGSEKEYPLDTTLFLKKTESGSYLVYDTNNIDIQQSTTMVRLRFFQDDQLVETMQVDAAAKQVQLPKLEVPEGKTFTGWFQKTIDAQGNQSLSLVFLPEDETNIIYIPEEIDLSAMDLYARFE